MAGPYLWERVTKTSVSSMQLAGDWTSEGPNAGGTILHLRSDKTGSLTGTLDVLGLSPFRQLLSKVSFDGNGLSFEGGNGSVFHGKINNEGKTLSGTFSQSSALITWQQIRNAAQAAAEDSKEKPRATDGAWNGVLNYTAKFPDLPLSKGKARLIFRFGKQSGFLFSSTRGRYRNSGDYALPDDVDRERGACRKGHRLQCNIRRRAQPGCPSFEWRLDDGKS